MATWFAQNSGVNIDSVNQWNSAANGSGSWLTWASLGASDVLVANGKTSITINVPVVCGELTTIANGGTAGGGFIWPGGVAITANLKPGFSQLLTTSGSGSRVITGNVFGSTLNAAAYALASTADAVTIVGNVTGGSGNVCRTLNNCSNVTVVGNVTGGVSHADSAALHSDGGGSVFVTGTVTAGVTSPAITSYTTITVVGTIQTSTTNVHAIASGTTTTLIHNGNLISAPSGTVPLRATTLNVLIDPSTTITHTYRVNNSGSAGAARSLYTGGVNLGQPTAADVRSGTAFGASSEYTGTLAVPSPTLVAIGVPTDNTVGSYSPSVNASDIRTAVGLATANLDTQLSGIQADTNDIQTRLPAALESGRIAAALDSASVDAIWNEVLTGATHNIAASAGRRLRQLADTVVLVDGVCDAASNAGTDSTGTITLAVGTTTACIGQAIRCENQVRFIASYDAGTRVAQLDRPWCVVPDAGDEYVVFNVRNPLVGLASLALAGSTAAAVNDVLVDTGTTLPAQINVIDDLLDTEMPALTAAVAAEAVKTTAIQAKTDNLPTDPADQSLLEAAITAATSPLATPAQVNAQVLDVLSVDTFAELTAPPAATSSLKDKITWLFMYARNKVTQTASARTLYRDDTTTVAGTSTTSDNGTTFTKGEDS